MTSPVDMLSKSFEHPDFDEELTFREFFQALLETLFKEEEGFSGKRPFGNSGWTGPLYDYLEKEKVKDPEIFIQQMIQAL